MKRHLYPGLCRWKDEKNRKPLILKGARQVGKSYLLREFITQEFKTGHYFNLEKRPELRAIFEKNLDPKRILTELELEVDCAIDPKTDCLFLDEIQSCPKALHSLKYFCEDLPELAVCAAGSLLGVTLSSEPFPVGKVTFLYLYPMNFLEFLEGLGESKLAALLQKPIDFAEEFPVIAHTRLWDLWKYYLIVGGLPESVQMFVEHKDHIFVALQKVREKQGDLIQTYLADMAKHSGRINSMHLERLWNQIPIQLAKNTDGSASKFVFKDVIPGVRGFERMSAAIDWLFHAGLVIKVPIVNSGESPLKAYVQENVFKLYFFDTGLLTALSELSPKTLWDYDFGSYKGYLAENFVAQELTAAHAGKTSLYSWRENTAEVEFLRDNEGQIVPIEVKSGNKVQAKSLKVFEGKYHPAQSIVLSGRPQSSQQTSHGEKLFLPLYRAAGIMGL